MLLNMIFTKINKINYFDLQFLGVRYMDFDFWLDFEYMDFGFQFLGFGYTGFGFWLLGYRYMVLWFWIGFTLNFIEWIFLQILSDWIFIRLGEDDGWMMDGRW
ncbi:hypothetical protein C1646_818677 [Rhizophagus diaphanus]|nr:hypothetical protein C1646_818677 [Rhizophagus diaphanus] [Rhizophagus sp. MUCL 43196]